MRGRLPHLTRTQQHTETTQSTLEETPLYPNQNNYSQQP